MGNHTVSEPKSCPMNGGDGVRSYMKNSSIQREAAIIAKTMIHEAISEKLDIENFSSTSNTFRVADLGCSVGPNTYIAMQNVIEAVEEKYKSKGALESELPEFQVFFNDHVTNDFKTLFTFLPPERRYFATGVPGSFYGRLFPESCVHIMHSSYALQWLSKVPEEVLDKDSAAWNKGRIYYTSAPDEVANAYAAQFAKDMDNFLNIRAKEIVAGGMMLLIMISAPDGIHRSQIGSGVMYDYVGSCLMDMAKAGLITEAQVDSFNLPVYTASPKEVMCLVKRNGCFGIERMMTTCPKLTEDIMNARICTMSIRAVLEGIITEHFGSEIIDELFNRIHQEVAGTYNQMDSRRNNGILLFLALKRK